MLIVTGTPRSGTSMWMQILIAAGFPAFGEAFPRNWGSSLRDANPDGFFESILREGVYWRTNPHPQTGEYFFPEQVSRHVVKVFIPGLQRTDRAFIGSVIATVRPWREYVASLERLYAIEEDARRAAGKNVRAPRRVSPALEWWSENFTLVRDIVTRRYRVHVQSYDGLLDDPEPVIADTLKWLGQGDLAAAVAAVRPANRTQRAPEDDGEIDPELAEVFDDLYDTVHRHRPITGSFVQKLNATHAQLGPRLVEQRREAMRDARRRRSVRTDAGRGEPGSEGGSPSW
jgi:hypothetical protein